MQRVSSVPVLTAIAAVLSLLLVGGCGGGNNKVDTTVATIVLTPTSVSLNEGAVATLSAIAQNAAGDTVPADITFSSSNSSIATVSSSGLVCGGVWDANIINCNATIGQGGVGTSTITASSGNVNATTTVYVHEKVDQVQAIVANNCTTSGQTVSISGKAFSTSAPGCSTSSPCDITSTVGPFTFGSNDTSIASVDTTTGDLVAAIPGSTTVFASVSGVNSVGTGYLTCPVATILVHSATDSSTSFTLNPAGTQPLTADVYDTNNRYIKPPLTWSSSSTAVATVAATGTVNNPGTITAVTGGTAYITAACSTPDCNKAVSAQYSQNVVTVNVNQPAPTTVYAASTNSKMLVPISTSNNTAGTAISLPNTPNSIISNPGGAAVYLGSSSGLMAVAASSGTVTTFSANGTIVAISPDGNFLLLSDSVGNQLNYFIITTGSIATSLPDTTVSSDAYTPDSKFNEWVMGTQLGVGLPTGLSGNVNLPFTASAVDIMAQGGLTYITSATGQQIGVYATCNQSPQQTLTADSPTLIRALPNGTGAVAADSPAIDVITTPSTLNAGCPVTTQSTINSYDLGAGSYTAQQLLVSGDSTRVWIVTDLAEVLTFNLTTQATNIVPLAGNATAYNGGLTLDGTRLYVGTSDNTVHEIQRSNFSDAAQITVNLKDSNGNITPPNLVTVLP